MKDKSASPECEPELPTIVTPGDLNAPPLKSAVEFQPQPATYRRHARKRSSTIIIPSPLSPTRSKKENGQTQSSSISGGAVTKGATVLALAQLLAKLLSFVLNQLLLRFVAAKDLGYAAQLDFFTATVLTLSRDAVRLTSQRRHTTSQQVGNGYRPDGRPIGGTLSGTQQEAVNLGWVAFGLGSALTGVILTGWRYFATDSKAVVNGALALYGAAAMVELASEPAFLLLQLRLRLDMRAKAEAMGTIVRCVVTLVLVILGKLPPALAFASGQLAYAATLLLLYTLWTVVEHRHALFTFRPQRIRLSEVSTDTLAYFDPETASLARGLESQVVAKHFLTEGDKVAVGLMTSLEQQGEYALAANYGSLVARLGLFPIEEALRAYFTYVLQDPPASALSPTTPSLGLPQSPRSPHTPTIPEVEEKSRDSDNDASNEKLAVPAESGLKRQLSRRIAPRPTNKKINSQAPEVLATVLRLYTYLGILAIGCGPMVTQFVLTLLLGGNSKPWLVGQSQTSSVLAAYCWYLPVLAWNGALEAFVQSAAGLGDLKHQRWALTGLAVLLVVVVYLFVNILGLGSTGLVWAQLVVMILRIAWSASFVNQWTGSTNWLKDCIPRTPVLAVSAVCMGLARYRGEVNNLHQLLILASIGGVVLATAVGCEREQFMTLLQLRQKNKQKVQ